MKPLPGFSIIIHGLILLVSLFKPRRRFSVKNLYCRYLLSIFIVIWVAGVTLFGAFSMLKASFADGNNLFFAEQLFSNYESVGGTLAYSLLFSIVWVAGMYFYPRAAETLRTFRLKWKIYRIKRKEVLADITSLIE